jgi:L-aspartate oxidase
MTRYAGVLRDAASLRLALDELSRIEASDPEVANLLVVSLVLVRAALAREESRGTHTRLDHLETSDAFLGRFVFAGSDEPAFVPLREIAPAR